MSNYRPYPKTKSSGVEWLGDVPEGWEVKPLKVIATFNDDVLSESFGEDEEIEYVDIGSVTLETGIERTATFRFGDAPSRARRRVRDGDVIASTVRTYLKAIAPVVAPPANLIVSTGFAVIRPRNGLDSHFAKFSLQSGNFVDEVISRSTGVSYPAINASEMAAISLALPPLPEQIQIAAFLDRECGKLDALQAKQQRLIELLKEKRQALISHAVTRGLDPTANLKPSGIEWLGDLPEGWKRAKLSHYIETRKGVAFKADDFTDQGRPVVKATDIKNGTLNPSGTNLPSNYPAIYPKAVLKSGNIILSTVGSIPEVKNSAVGQICEVPASHDGFLLNQNTVIFSTDVVKLDQRFCFMLLKCDHYRDHLDLHAHGTANQASLNVEDMLDFDFPLPPLAEQRAIVAHLDKKCGKIDQLKAKAERGIELLKERRSALISAAVTGKIDVREVAAVSKRQAP